MTLLLIAGLALAAFVGIVVATRKRHGKLRSLQALLASAGVGALIAFLALTAGGVGSAYPEPIKNAAPLAWLESGGDYAAEIFWGIAITAFFLAGLHYWAADRIREEGLRDLQIRSDRLRDQSAELASTIRTLPPDAFMNLFKDLCQSAIEAFNIARQHPAHPAIAVRSVRVVLRSIATLAEAFDRNTSGATYSVHLLLYCSQPTQMDELPKGVAQVYPPNQGPQKLRGALLAHPKLATVASDRDSGGIDSKPLLLPIPDPARDKEHVKHPHGKLRTLPGAATAFATQTFGIYSDASCIRTQIEKEHQLEEGVTQACVDYFTTGGGKNSRSFVCIPIFDPREEDSAIPLRVLGDAPAVGEEIAARTTGLNDATAAGEKMSRMKAAEAPAEVGRELTEAASRPGGSVGDGSRTVLAHVQLQRNKPDPMAVLNIDCNVTGIFGNDARTVINFQLAIAPLLQIVQKILTTTDGLLTSDISCLSMLNALALDDETRSARNDDRTAAV